MPNSRAIIRNPGRAQDDSLGAQPVAVLTAARGTTERIQLDTNGSAAPATLLASNVNRKAAIIYNPTTDPVTAAAGATMYVGYELERAGTFFPVEPGGVFVHENRDWLYVWTAAAAPTIVYVAEELY